MIECGMRNRKREPIGHERSLGFLLGKGGKKCSMDDIKYIWKLVNTRAVTGLKIAFVCTITTTTSMRRAVTLLML